MPLCLCLWAAICSIFLQIPSNHQETLWQKDTGFNRQEASLTIFEYYSFQQFPEFIRDMTISDEEEKSCVNRQCVKIHIYWCLIKWTLPPLKTIEAGSTNCVSTSKAHWGPLVNLKHWYLNSMKTYQHSIKIDYSPHNYTRKEESNLTWTLNNYMTYKLGRWLT